MWVSRTRLIPQFLAGTHGHPISLSEPDRFFMCSFAHSLSLKYLFKPYSVQGNAVGAGCAVMN